MGNYGTGTLCRLCDMNHPTYADAVACADIVWRGHAPPTVLASPIPDYLPDDIATLLVFDPEA